MPATASQPSSEPRTFTMTQLLRIMMLMLLRLWISHARAHTIFKNIELNWSCNFLKFKSFKNWPKVTLINAGTFVKRRGSFLLKRPSQEQNCRCIELPLANYIVSTSTHYLFASFYRTFFMPGDEAYRENYLHIVRNIFLASLVTHPSRALHARFQQDGPTAPAASTNQAVNREMSSIESSLLHPEA